MKFKRFIHKNKVLLIVLVTVLLLAIAVYGAIIFINKKNNEVVEEPVEDNGPKIVEELKFMTVTTKPSLKLSFKETYELCEVNGVEERCADSEIEQSVVSFEALNEEASIYANSTLVGKNLEEALVEICDTAKDNKVSFNKVEILTNSKNVDKTDLMQYIVLHGKGPIDYTLSLNVDEAAS